MTVRTMGLALFVLGTTVVTAAAEPLLRTSSGGELIVQYVKGSAAAVSEFGVEISLEDGSLLRLAVFSTRHKQGLRETEHHLGNVAAGTGIDVYVVTSFGETYEARSAIREDDPSPSNAVVFADRDNSLGLGGSVVEDLGRDDWLLHLDDAASHCCDDDDNDLVVRIRILSGLTSQLEAHPDSAAVAAAAI